MKLCYTDRAIIDLDLATSWYEKQRKGLGIEFLDNIDQTTRVILNNPSLYPIKHKQLRCAAIKRFPFTIFYSVSEFEIVVHAVFDNRQDPIKRP